MSRMFICCASLAALVSSTAVHAEEPVQLSVGGYAKMWMGYASNDNGKDYTGNNFYFSDFPPYSTTNANNGSLNPAGFDVHGDVEVDFVGKASLSNGLRVTAEVDLSPTTNKLTASSSNKDIKRAYGSLSGKYGSIAGGMRENIGEIIHNSAPDITGIGAQDGYWWEWILTPTGHRGLQRTYLGDDENDEKVIYLSPDFHGLAFGFSYTPSINHGTAGSATSPTAFDGITINPVTGAQALGGDLYVYGLSYHHSFGNLGLKADLSSGQANAGGLAAYQAGLQLTYAGFTAGGSFLKRDVRNAQPAFKDALAQGFAWDAGISYSIGPYALAANYFAERAAKGNATDANSMAGLSGVQAALGSTSYAYDSDRVIALEGTYQLGRGISVNATVFNVTYTDAYGISAEKNSGWGALTGLAIRF